MTSRLIKQLRLYHQLFKRGLQKLHLGSFMVLEYSNCNTCVCTDNLDLLEQTLTRIFEQEGCRRIPKPPLPQNSLPVMKTLLSRSWEIEPYLWVIGLFVGNQGWTIVQTQPSELLCRRAKDTIRPRLSSLAMQTGCNTFHYKVYDRTWGVILEADASGRTFASGDLDCYDVEKMKFYDEPVTERTGGLNFFLLNVPSELQAVARIRIHNYQERQRRKSELIPLMRQSGETREEAESEYEQLCKSNFEIQDEALGQTLIGSLRYWDYWHQNNPLYLAYTLPQQLEADGARLLYFQPAGFDRELDVEKMWSEIGDHTNTDNLLEGIW
ncbi:MAG: hypothetical protein PUP91_37465 [Rhizonema sp. PD37]|nr:hypothetical protein [Rhizonema sp. PD37]